MKRKDIYIGTQRILYQIINEKLSYLIFRGKYFVNNWFSYIFSIEKSLCVNSLSYSLLFFLEELYVQISITKKCMSCKRFFFYHFFRVQNWSLILNKSLSQFANTCSFLGEGMNEFCGFSVCLYLCEDIIQFYWELFNKRASSFKNIYSTWIKSWHLDMQHHSLNKY